MITEYLIGEKKYSTAESCSDLDIFISESENRFTAKVTAKTDLTLGRAVSQYHFNSYKNDLYFFNGYQSWTDTKECYIKEKEKDVYKIPKFLLSAFSFDRYGDATFYGYGKDRLHGYDVFWAKGKNQRFIFNVNGGAYLIIEFIKKFGVLNLISDSSGKSLKAGESFVLFDYYFYEDYEKGLNAFKKQYPEKPTKKILGYTSWYNYYQNINEEIILRDLSALDNRFDLFQIDDGYETFVGDWLDVDSQKFPNGLLPIVKDIKEKGFTAGIWLAPFVAEEKSKLFAEHKEYFKRNADGEFVKCGSNWSGFYALDVYKPEVKEYIRKCLTHYKDMGFDFFKLDFLFAAHLPEYEGKTRCEVASFAYTFLREVLGDSLILGCGGTLFNSANVFDYLRIGPDVSLKFDDNWYMKFIHRERPSTKITLQNTVYRSVFDKRFFGNDPDVFLLRDENISLSKNQRIAALTVDALFGSLMLTSDNIKEYDEVKKTALNTALDIFYNAKDVKYDRHGKFIEISYTLKNERKDFKYHTKKGVIYGR